MRRLGLWNIIIGLVVLAACSSAATPTPTPTFTPEATLVPSNTPLVRPTLPPAYTATPTPDVSATPTLIQIDPLLGIKVEPPLTIDLPDGWQLGYDTLLFEDAGELTSVPIALYQGPVTGGQGTIVLVWNFRSVTAGVANATPTGDPDMWIDGLRLLRALVFDAACNMGTDAQRDFTVGGLPATGTNFRAVDCPDAPNTKGWFAGLTVNEVNFVFYLYTDPIDALKDPVPFELQAILDSVVFEVPKP